MNNKEKKVKALVLLSGGLDSILAVITLSEILVFILDVSAKISELVNAKSEKQIILTEG